MFRGSEACLDGLTWCKRYISEQTQVYKGEEEQLSWDTHTPPCRLAERTKGLFFSQFITATVSGCLGSVMLTNWSGKLRFRSKSLLLLRPW